ncbi:MAG TPA: OmpA family protein [Thermoanaerobaculia bacterium]|jgi:outer membrane protein OmpA-like peptidoglycan-associated protein
MKVFRAVTVATLAGLLGACATNSAVDKRIQESQAATNQRIESVASQVEDLQTKQKQTDVKLDQLSQEAREALKRAQDAGVLAKGKVVFEQAFSEDRVKFGVDKYELGQSAQGALSDFAGKVKALDEQFFIEIQGHTDDTGGSRYNEDLGQRRADSVRRYLARQFSIPLNRMSTISYGDTLPVASNKTKAGRSQNRRVVLVVLE